MCDFPSWVKDGRKIYFLTDKDAARQIREHPSTTYYDYVGHSALRKLYPDIKGTNCEGFPCPLVIANAIKAGRMKKLMKAGDYESLTFDSKSGLHSFDDLPAVVRSDGTKYWYKNGKLHRDKDLPAIVYSNGTKHWYKNGKIHRDNDKPAVVYSNGDKAWYKNGKLHRDKDLPATVYSNGEKCW